MGVQSNSLVDRSNSTICVDLIVQVCLQHKNLYSKRKINDPVK